MSRGETAACGENRREDFLARKVARNRRNNIRAVVQTIGTAPEVGTNEEEKWSNKKIKCRKSRVLVCASKERTKKRKKKIVGRHMSREFLREPVCG